MKDFLVANLVLEVIVVLVHEGLAVIIVVVPLIYKKSFVRDAIFEIFS